MVFAVSWHIAAGISLALVIYRAVHARYLKTVHYEVRLENRNIPAAWCYSVICTSGYLS